jgi:hypothetical protein
MRSDLVRAARLGSLCLIVASGAVALGGARAPIELDNHLRREVVRLRAHFDSVDSELRARDVSGLTPAQRAQRQRLIGWLAEYRDAGVFPINDRFPGRLVPFFRDSKGTLCAMAYLIDRSGRGDIVDQIASTRNNAFIPELADDPALAAWLNSAGLEVTEAARIQPAYDFPPFTTDANRVSSDFAIATVLLGGGSLAASTVNVVSPSLVSEVAGLLVGGGAILQGINHLDQNRGTKRVANASIITGSVSVAASLASYVRSRMRTRANADRSSLNGEGRVSRVIISPTVMPAQSSYRLGLAATASF